ncbi:hypothetical protein BOTCAL_0551g00070 [Botryotinia calthae]|uniref:Uncharacterized protein n=1 Tax=Botryotinia calthae TaxID=38488 RepID=A0A4Y8CM97_9HELO|nr:hypothetical protein BOTCAL_0551g00070 [Botryotinia calthae]
MSLKYCFNQPYTERPRIPEMNFENRSLNPDQNSPTNRRIEIESNGKQPEGYKAIEKNITIMAEICILKSRLGAHYFKDINKSYRRSEKKNRQRLKFTNTIHLHIASRVNKDFKFEI